MKEAQEFLKEALNPANKSKTMCFEDLDLALDQAQTATKKRLEAHREDGDNAEH